MKNVFRSICPFRRDIQGLTVANASIFGLIFLHNSLICFLKFSWLSIGKPCSYVFGLLFTIFLSLLIFFDHRYWRVAAVSQDWTWKSSKDSFHFRFLWVTDKSSVVNLFSTMTLVKHFYILSLYHRVFL